MLYLACFSFETTSVMHMLSPSDKKLYLSIDLICQPLSCLFKLQMQNANLMWRMLIYKRKSIISTGINVNHCTNEINWKFFLLWESRAFELSFWFCVQVYIKGNLQSKMINHATINAPTFHPAWIWSKAKSLWDCFQPSAYF